jgi:hypothetical protein
MRNGKARRGKNFDLFTPTLLLLYGKLFSKISKNVGQFLSSGDIRNDESISVFSARSDAMLGPWL